MPDQYPNRARLRRRIQQMIAGCANETRRATRAARGLGIAIEFDSPERPGGGVELEAAARHEAGHIIAGVAYGATPIAAVVVDLEHRKGERFRDGFAYTFSTKPWAHMVCARAGRIAEGVLDQIGLLDFNLFVRAFERHEQQSKKVVDGAQCWKRAGRLAREALRRHSDAHEKLTSALLQHRVLDRNAIIGALRGTSLKPPRHTPKGVEHALRDTNLPQLIQLVADGGDTVVVEGLKTMLLANTAVPAGAVPVLPESTSSITRRVDALISTGATELGRARDRAREELVALAPDADRTELEAIAAGDMDRWRQVVAARDGAARP